MTNPSSSRWNNVRIFLIFVWSLIKTVKHIRGTSINYRNIGSKFRIQNLFLLDPTMYFSAILSTYMNWRRVFFFYEFMLVKRKN